MKFRNNQTGSIVEPNDDMVLDQMKTSPFYTAIPDAQTAPDADTQDQTQGDGQEGAQDDEKAEGKPLSKMNKDELLATAQAAGIDVPDGSTKAEIVEMIQAAEV